MLENRSIFTYTFLMFVTKQYHVVVAVFGWVSSVGCKDWRGLVSVPTIKVRLILDRYLHRNIMQYVVCPVLRTNVFSRYPWWGHCLPQLSLRDLLRHLLCSPELHTTQELRCSRAEAGAEGLRLARQRVRQLPRPQIKRWTADKGPIRKKGK